MNKDTRRRDLDALAKQGIQFNMPEVDTGEAPEIETVAETDLGSLAADEAFMNERVRIRLATTTDPNAPPEAIVTVNSSAHRAVIPRGVPMWVKRMHVEVLARMRETRYTQPTRNPMDPESGNRLIPSDAMVYPFEVLEDPNPRGRAWLERVLADRS